MKRIVLLTVLALALTGCKSARATLTSADVVREQTDTTDVLEAIWRVPVSSMTLNGERWLYLPDADSAAVTVSEAVRAALAQRGVPASTRRPVGHDTIVYQVRRWARDPSGASILTLASSWTRMSKSVPSLCTTGGNEETYRAHRSGTGWEAERIGRGLHGNGYCKPSGK